MKIDSSKPLNPTLSRNNDRVPSNGAASAERSSSVDSVTINPLAAKLSQLEQSTKPTFDAERVESLKKAISEGRFTVRTEAIAGKIIQSAQELLGK
ncbi:MULTISPECIES: flagellar biosynthesis anti-sigma factor FlgM [unclassified Iodobacter]|uniref:flagellar biosynthesis anti-sigma factor FlgM n=1 Tax=unclassified Iodobacter TaxID=235634 RepID=UPI0025DC5006|nr:MULTISPECIES: flagellar biosynthesis anti-sigma factor FlgM [unclassified Iodobacter]MDW5417660.1 flagellar biosynthesis anti-sigma factor FlgM [Iodobacter sp. CM08]